MQNSDQGQPQPITYPCLTLTKDNQSPYINNYSQPTQPVGQIEQCVSMITTQEPQNQYPIFIPIIQNSNNLQQPMINNQSDQIKNLPFPQQKSMFLKMLALLSIASVIEYFLMFGLYILFSGFMDNIAPILFPFSLIALLGILKLGSDRKYQKNVHPFIIYILAIYLIPQTLVTMSRLFNHTRPPYEDGFYITVADLVFMAFAVLIGFNGFSTLFTLIYLLIENKKISVIPIIAVLSGCSLILILVFWPIFVDCAAAIVYGILLVNCLNQISAGRFQLKDKDVFFNANALLYGIIVPFDFSE